MPLDVGKVLPDSRPGFFVWKIGDFFSFPQGIDSYPIVSPKFTALGAEWWLHICPTIDIHGIPHTELQLRKTSSSPARYVSYTVGIRGRDGVKLIAGGGQKEFTEYDNFVQYYERTHLSQQQDRDLWAPCGTLTVFLHLQDNEVSIQAEESLVQRNHWKADKCTGEIHPQQSKSCSSSSQCNPWNIDTNTRESNAGLSKSCNSSIQCSPWGTDTNTIQSDAGRSKSCSSSIPCSPWRIDTYTIQSNAGLSRSCSSTIQRSPWETDTYTGENNAGLLKSCSSSTKDVGVQTDDFDEHSEVCECKRCHQKGRDVATQTTEEYIENSEEESHDVEATPEILAGTWQMKISQLYDTKECSDVRFVVDGHIFEAHRLVLATRSPKFCRLLTSANAAYDTHIVEAENITAAAFDILLRFLYKDTLGTTDKKSIIEVYHCALAYQVEDLMENCEEKMRKWDMDLEDVCTLLDCGLDVSTLRSRCMDLLRREGKTVLSSPAFLQISFRTLRFMLESGALENVPALQRIERILEWYEHLHPDEADCANARNKLLGDETNPLLGRLGLENLELKELSYVVNRYRGLITPEELVNFLRYCHSQNKSVLPDWCLLKSSE